MEMRALGSHGLYVSTLGLGCMGMSEFYQGGDDKESEATIHRALDLGVNFLNTADMYGVGRNEELVGRVVRGSWSRRSSATFAALTEASKGSMADLNMFIRRAMRACRAMAACLKSNGLRRTRGVSCAADVAASVEPDPECMVALASQTKEVFRDYEI